MIERTLVIIKPDGVTRGLIGEIISRYEKKGFTIAAAQLIQADEELIARHYEEHQGKHFFEKLMRYLTSGKVLAIVVQGNDVVDNVRRLNGDKDPHIADIGTIRGDFASSITENIVHASDSKDSAAREIAIWFPDFHEEIRVEASQE